MIGAGWPAPRWYYWCDAWIFVGSMVATYAMARGWNDFWLAWIAVDLVGVPAAVALPATTRRRSCTSSTAASSIWGFVVWLRASRTRDPEPRARGGGGMSALSIRLDTVERAIADIARGQGRCVVVDDEDRENEGDLIFAAAKATPELMAFTIRHTSGVICVPMPAEMLDRLEIPLMTPHNRDRMRTAYTDLGRRPRRRHAPASAPPTAPTPLRVLADSATEPCELTRPGPRVPAALPRGRRAATRAATPRRPSTWPGWRVSRRSGVLVEIVNDDGTDEALAGSCATSPTSTAWR